MLRELQYFDTPFLVELTDALRRNSPDLLALLAMAGLRRASAWVRGWNG